MKLFLLFLLSASALYAGEFSYRVRREVLDQLDPCTVYVSTRGLTTLQFPAPIKAVDGGDGFTTKPAELVKDETADFYISPGDNWLSVQSLKPGAEQNLSIVIAGKVYAVYLKTVEENDFTVLFRFPERAKPANHTAPTVWSPTFKNTQ